MLMAPRVSNFWVRNLKLEHNRQKELNQLKKLFSSQIKKSNNMEIDARKDSRNKAFWEKEVLQLFGQLSK